MTSPDELQFLTAHRAHDPGDLIARWRSIADRAGLAIAPFARAGEHELFMLRSAGAPAGARRVYLSAGVHGDEPGAALGLLTWAEQNAPELRELDLLISPLLNPWGLENNTRHDQRGRDLNRLFHSRAAPFPAWRRAVGGGGFDLSICLHEDFDACGSYIYELGEAGIAERLLAAGSRFVAADPRGKIDQSAAVGGVIRRAPVSLEELPVDGMPEAVWFYFERCRVSLTIETPSEFSLYRRACAHAAMLSEAIWPAV